MAVCEKCGKEIPEGSGHCSCCASGDVMAEVEPPRKLGDGESFCSRCGMIVPPYKENCPQCGAAVAQSLVRFKASDGMCPRCGRAFEAGTSVCKECLLAAPDYSIYDVPSKKGYSGHKIVGILLMASFALIVAMIVMIMMGSGESAVEKYSSEYLDASALVSCCTVTSFVAAISCLVGAYFSFKRSNHTLVIFASAIGVIGLGVFFLASVLSIMALIIAAFSRDDYRT